MNIELSTMVLDTSEEIKSKARKTARREQWEEHRKRHINTLEETDNKANSKSTDGRRIAKARHKLRNCRPISLLHASIILNKHV
jgi:hypothetical protein